MKLYLHWLRHDIRRLRLLLAGWFLAVTGYALFLGWLHLHILTVDSDWIRWSAWILYSLIGLDLILLGGIFYSDPAGGTRAFWKTRPPTGFAVAAAKITLAVGFLLILPLLAWWTMKAVCVLPGKWLEDSPLSWTGTIWWTQAILISIAALGAAGGEGTEGMRGVPMRIFQVTGVILCVMLAGFAVDFFSGAPAPWLSNAKVLFRGSRTVLMALLALPVCAGIFIAARRGRVPCRFCVPAIVIVPPVLILLTAMLYKSTEITRLDESLPPLEAALAQQISITEPSHLFDGLRTIERIGGGWTNSENGEPTAIYGLNIRLSGLPADSIASGRWLDFRLTTRDGRVAAADPALMRRRTEEKPHSDPSLRIPDDSLGDCAVVFRQFVVEPFSLTPCTGSGTLRLTILTRREHVMELRDSLTADLPWGRVRQEFRYWNQMGYASDFFFKGIAMEDLLDELDMRSIRHQPPAGLTGLLRHQPTGISESLRLDGGPERGAFLCYERQTDDLGARSKQVTLTRRHPELEGAARSDWRLVLTWWEPFGIVDLPVSVPPLIFPSMPGDTRSHADIICGLLIRPETPSEEVRRDLDFVEGIFQWPDSRELRDASWEKDWRTFPAPPGSRREAWNRLLASITREHLPVLLDKCAHVLLHDSGNSFFAESLRHRIGQLLEAADVPAIRSRTPLAEYLKDVLPPSRLNPGPNQR